MKIFSARPGAAFAPTMGDAFALTGQAATETYVENLSHTEPGPSVEPVIIPQLVDLNPLTIVGWL
jgi:hypothetical protein